MKRDYTFTIFAGAVASVIVALYLVSPRTGYQPISKNDFVTTSVIHNLSPNEAPESARRIVFYDDHENTDSLIDVIWEDRDNIEIRNKECYGENTIDVAQTRFVEQENQLEVYFEHNMVANDDSYVCDVLEVLLPSHKTLLDVSHLPKTTINLHSNTAAIDVTVKAYNVDDIVGQYDHLQLWQLGNEKDEVSYAGYLVEAANLNTLTLYAQRPFELRLNNNNVHFNQANFYTLNDIGYIGGVQLSSLANIHYHPLDDEAFSRLEAEVFASEAQR